MERKTALWAAGSLAAALAAYVAVVRPRHLRWGATVTEAEEYLPGDEFVPQCTESSTHAITIEAPTEAVWPWLAQIGQDKAGFYSYTWLENLVGCRMPRAERIVPEFQDLRIGDKVWLHPKAPPLPALLIEQGRTIVLGSNMDEPGTWAFYLKKIDAKTTRLVVRGRGAMKPGLLRWMGQYVLFEPAHFIMERKMLLSIKQHAEESARQSGHSEETRPRVAA